MAKLPNSYLLTDFDALEICCQDYTYIGWLVLVSVLCTKVCHSDILGMERVTNISTTELKMKEGG